MLTFATSLMVRQTGNREYAMNRREHIISIAIVLLGFMADGKAQQKGLSRAEAEQCRERIVAEWLSREASLLKHNDEAHCITQGDLHLRYDAKVFGEEPADGRSLWISGAMRRQHSTTANGRTRKDYTSPTKESTWRHALHGMIGTCGSNHPSTVCLTS